MVHNDQRDDDLPDRPTEAIPPTASVPDCSSLPQPPGDATRILARIQSGDPSAAEELLPLVYEELRRLAAAKMAREDPGQTLQATALVHEAYLRLVGQGTGGPSWDNRWHFFAAAAEAMRRILVEQARKQQRRDAIRGSRICLDELSLSTPSPSPELLRLDEVLQKLERTDPLVARLVKLRFFAGLTLAQAADALGLTKRTAERNWTYARSWLHRELDRPAD
jgi:RNA polymerase sigma factor (TIGR02999 family)